MSDLHEDQNTSLLNIMSFKR